MEIEERIASNFEQMLNSGEEKLELFKEPSETELEALKNLIGDQVSKVIAFFGKYQPYDFPLLKTSYVRLLRIEDILEENESNEPGQYLAKEGVFVFALTIGGSALCIDTNDMKDGDPAVLLIDEAFCYYSDVHDFMEINLVPDEVQKELPYDEPMELTYKNLKRCLPVFESSFLAFMEKLSKDEYGDMEEYLEND